MKKLIIATAITTSLLSLVSMNANAAPNTGIIKFSGAISAATCEMNVVVDGVVSPTGVVDLGVYDADTVNTGLASAPGAFGTAKAVSLVPDAATCAGDPTGATTAVKIDASQTDATNTSVVTSADTTTTNAGVLFTLADDTAVVNVGTVTLETTDSNLDATTGSIKFKVQPFAVTDTVAAGIIGGSVSYTVAYL